uniref:hypothetical protein n=1 Tax=Flavobacterium sp. TaxID=239 RepID=UPI00404A2550
NTYTYIYIYIYIHTYAYRLYYTVVYHIILYHIIVYARPGNGGGPGRWMGPVRNGAAALVRYGLEPEYSIL